MIETIALYRYLWIYRLLMRLIGRASFFSLLLILLLRPSVAVINLFRRYAVADLFAPIVVCSVLRLSGLNK